MQIKNVAGGVGALGTLVQSAYSPWILLFLLNGDPDSGERRMRICGDPNSESGLTKIVKYLPKMYQSLTKKGMNDIVCTQIQFGSMRIRKTVQ